MTHSAQSRELELKFHLEPETLRRLLRPRWLSPIQLGRARSTVLDSTYFDTPELSLKQSGAAIRIRRDGKKLVQCYKAKAPDSKGGFQRVELEHELAEEAIDLRAVQEALGDGALPIKDAGSLEPVFKTVMTRTTRRLSPRPGVEISFDLDLGEVVSGDRREAIRELELELVAGEAGDLFDFALELLERAPMQLAVRSKAARGYALFTGAAVSWNKGSQLALPSGITASEALALRVLNCVEQIRNNQDCVMARSHIEGVHQLRVGTRRLRSTLSTYRKYLPPEQYDKFKLELKWLIGEFGPARDWDVFLDETLKPILEWMPEEPAILALEEEAKGRREAGYERAQSAIASARYTRLLLEITRWADGRQWLKKEAGASEATLELPESSESPAEPAKSLTDSAERFGRPLLEKRHRHLLRDGKHIRRMSSDEKHTLRIAVKKLRYTTELFQSLYPQDKVGIYIAHLKALQDKLGVLNDVVVARAMLAKIVESAPPTKKERLIFASGLVVGWQVHIAQRQHSEMDRVWTEFTESERFW